MIANLHRYSGYVLLGASVVLVSESLFSNDWASKALGALFLLSAGLNYFTAAKTTTST